VYLFSPAETASLELASWQEIYNRHRFLDVFEATAPWWNTATDLSSLSIEELVFAARLAQRLGAPRLCRSLLRRARKKDPTHPAVRYFADHLRQPGYLLLDDLVAFEAHPKLAGADAKLEADWLANYAIRWAQLRHWERSAELMREAHVLSPDSAWLHSIESDIYGMADNWQAALHSAERAWELDSGSPGVVSSVSNALLHNGELHEAVRRLEWAAAGTQSAQIVQTASWYRCAAAELLEGEERLASLDAARALAARIEPLAPLADQREAIFGAGTAQSSIEGRRLPRPTPNSYRSEARTYPRLATDSGIGNGDSS
jgi:hypothetical protein